MTVHVQEAKAPDSHREEPTPVARTPATKRGFPWRFAVVLVVAGGVAAVLAVSPAARARAEQYATTAYHSITGGGHAETGSPEPRPNALPRGPWDGVLSMTKEQAKSLGLELKEVLPQTEPLRIEVSGKTDYDPNTLNKVRPKFKSLIDKVYVEYGQEVKKGDPLVDLFSADLAEAKGHYETKMAQWEHDRAELARSAELRRSGAESEKIYLSVLNDEKKSGTEAKIARDALLVLGLSDDEIAAVPKEDGTKKAKMTLRAPGSGVVIARDVVQGNLYDQEDVLLTIAQLDHFWVYGFVYPSDASRVSLGQNWVIDCPFAGLRFETRIESITTEIDKETKTIRIRTRIDNKSHKLKSDMLVTGRIEIPPPAKGNRMIIPRLSMVSADGGDYAFVLKTERSSGSDDAPMRFERRRFRVIHEGADGVYVADDEKPGEGLAAGEQVVTKGSLLLMQMYDDEAALASGVPQ